MRTYDQLEQVCLQLEYVWDTEDRKINSIFERTNDEITNKFTDWWHLVFIRDGLKVVLSIPATTKAGIKGAIDSPIEHNGIIGTAIIIPDQYVNSWEFHDTDKEFSHYPYFRQVQPIMYWRDGNKDLEIDRVNEEKGIAGTHWHIMSNVGTYGSGLVNNWSEGCMGSPEPEYKKILSAVREHVLNYGNLFTGTILESKDFN